MMEAGEISMTQAGVRPGAMLPRSHVERAKLLEAVMESKEPDNEALMNKIRHRMDNVGLKFPAVEVRFQNLQVEASVYLGTRALPTLSNFAWNALTSALTSARIMRDARKQLPILHGVAGVLKPGRFTLLLGPPGGGKSTLMKALSGRSDAGLKVSGDVTYNGHALGEFEPIRTAAYVPQSDKHIAEMTVRETLQFSAQVQGQGFRTQQAAGLSVLERDSGVEADADVARFMDALAAEGVGSQIAADYVLKILGLDVCAETILGDAFKRGVSGGQKKRVTTGEMMVGPRQVLFMDEISTGLDSSTTYLITQCLRHFTHATDATVLVALLQPAPETYQLFDDVMLLSEGHVVYHGPREKCPGFFQQVGFKCPERKGEPDFLQEVTSLKDQQQYWVGAAPYTYIPVQRFAREFRKSVEGRLTAHRLLRQFPRDKGHPDALQKSKYALPHAAMFAAVFGREWMLWRRNWFLVFAQLLQMVIMGFIGGTVYFRTRLGVNIQDGTYYLGALFFGIMSMLFNGFSDLTLLVTRLPVFYKQRDENMYPAWAWGLPIILLSLPVSVAAGAIYTGIAYFLMGFTPDAGRFFMQLVLFALVHQMALALFRLAGAVGRSMVVALTFGSFLLVVLFVLGGYILPRNLIPGFWIWGFWASPISYAQNALSVNELLAPRWQVLAGPIAPGSTVGLVVLSTRDLFHENSWRWIGVASQICYLVLFNALTVAALAFLRPWGQPQPVLSEEQLQEKVAARTGDMDAMSIAHDRKEQRRSSTSSLDPFRSAPQSFVASDGTIALSSKRLASQPCPDLEALSEADGEGRHGMILPFTPLSLSFHNVNYCVDMPAEMKAEGATGDRLHLLKNVSGAFRPRVLTALMGVSGAGKTTLMDVLAGRKTGGYIEGDIRVSGYPKVQQTFARIAGYCEQTDVHTPQVTVRESLIYSAWLRLPSEADRKLREEFVDEVMELVELEPLGDALVGMPGVDGLSTEQRKRLTIAVELVANPSIIFMDEPTSGLDARAAAIVMRAVRNTVDTGRTVVCTIHQPSIDIFEAFDELLLMKRGGQVIYNGPLGASSRYLVNYFESVPGVPPIQEGYNPAAWMLDVSGPAMADSLGVDFAELYKSSDLFKRNAVLIEELKTPPPGQQDLHFPTVYSRGFGAQLNACLWKRNRMYWRAPSYNVVRMFFATVMGLLMGGVFFGLGAKRSTSVEVLTVMGAMYTASLFMGFNNQATVQPILSVERSVFYRERAAGLYGAYSYALAQGLVEIPYVLTQTLIYSLLTYSMFKLEWHGGKFVWYTVFMFLTLLYFTYYGMMAVAITPNEELATVVSSLFFGLWNVLCGFLLPGPAIPGWWKWFYWINPVSWTLYGLVTSQLGDVSTPITEPGKVPRAETVQEFLQSYFGFYHSNLGYNLLVLVVFTIGFFAIFAVALKRLNFQNR